MVDQHPSDVLAAMFDETTSALIGMLEDGPKTITELVQLSNLEADDIHNRFKPLIKSAIIIKTNRNGNTIYEVNPDKLDSALDDSSHFDGTIKMVTTMDTYLN